MFKNNKKTFNTKKINMWKKLDIIVFIFILGINIIGLFNPDNGDAFKGLDENQNLLVYILLGIFLLIVVFVKSLPFMAIYFAFKYAIKKYRISSATFNANNDIEYYRDIFKDISPATMSLLMDLGLESNKDLGAMRLYYELNDVIKYDDDGNIYFNNSGKINLSRSDDILLNYFIKGNKDIFELNEWKENVICENVNNGLVRRKTNKEKKKSGCGLFVFIYIITLVLMILSIMNIGDLNEFSNMLDSAPVDNVVFLNFISTNEEYVRIMLLLLGFMVSFLVHIWNFIASGIYFIASNSVKVKDKIRRTDKGDFLAEKLYGMKNFINDFSNLDEASRNHLVLWKEFLIYAVVLEENDIILKEISNAYNFDLSNYKNRR